MATSAEYRKIGKKIEINNLRVLVCSEPSTEEIACICRNFDRLFGFKIENRIVYSSCKTFIQDSASILNFLMFDEVFEDFFP